MATPVAKIKLALDNSELVKKLKQTTGRFKEWAGGVNISMTAVAGVAVGVAAAIAGIAVVTKKLSDAYAVQEEAEGNFLAAARTGQEFTDDQFASLSNVLSARQQLLGVGDEQNLQDLTTLSLMGIRNEKLAESLPRIDALNLLTKNSVTSTRLLGRVMNGEVSALTRYGIKATSVADAMQKLDRMQNTVNARSRRLSTRFKVLDANTGDLVETLGKGVGKSEALKGGIDAMSTVTLKFIKLLDNPKVFKVVNSFFGVIADLSASTVDAFLGMTKAARDFINFEIGVINDSIRFFGGKTKFELFQTTEVEKALEDFADDLRKAAKKGVGGGVVDGLDLPGGGGGGAGDEAVDPKKLAKLDAERRRASLDQQQSDRQRELDEVDRIAKLRLAIVKAADDEDIARAEEHDAKLREISRRRTDHEVSEAHRVAQAKRQIAIDGAQAGISLLAAFGKASTDSAKKQFRINQAAGVANTVVNTAAGVQRQFAEQFFWVALATSAVIIASGAAQIATILGQSFDGGAKSVATPQRSISVTRPSAGSGVGGLPTNPATFGSSNGGGQGNITHVHNYYAPVIGDGRRAQRHLAQLQRGA